MTSTTTTPDKGDGFDIVKKPKHYNVHPSGVECHTIAEPFGYYLGNAVKYIWRNGIKSSDTAVQDLKKAMWYLGAEIKRLEKAQQDADILNAFLGPAPEKSMLSARCPKCADTGWLLDPGQPWPGARVSCPCGLLDAPKADQLHPG